MRQYVGVTVELADIEKLIDYRVVLGTVFL